MFFAINAKFYILQSLYERLVIWKKEQTFIQTRFLDFFYIFLKIRKLFNGRGARMGTTRRQQDYQH